jgi:hypothetical protein
MIILVTEIVCKFFLCKLFFLMLCIKKTADFINLGIKGEIKFGIYRHLSFYISANVILFTVVSHLPCEDLFVVYIANEINSLFVDIYYTFEIKVSDKGVVSFPS